MAHPYFRHCFMAHLVHVAPPAGPKWDIRGIARPAKPDCARLRYYHARPKTSARAIWPKNKPGRPPAAPAVTLSGCLTIFHARAYRRVIQWIVIISPDILPGRCAEVVGDHFLGHTQFVGRLAAGSLTQNKNLATALISSVTWRR